MAGLGIVKVYLKNKLLIIPLGTLILENKSRFYDIKFNILKKFRYKMANIQDNYSNINEFLNKSLSVFRKHMQYTEQFTSEFEQLYQIGQNLQSDYAELVRSNLPGKESDSTSIIDE